MFSVRILYTNGFQKINRLHHFDSRSSVKRQCIRDCFYMNAMPLTEDHGEITCVDVIGSEGVKFCADEDNGGIFTPSVAMLFSISRT